MEVETKDEHTDPAPAGFFVGRGGSEGFDPAGKKVRAYSVLEIKRVDEGRRTFSGIASTPSTDRMGDVVEPKGAQFKLPIPLLWQHDSRDPIGWVDKAKVTKGGIEVEGRVADIPAEDSPALKDRLQTAWAYIKNRLVRGLSIGFNPKEFSFMDSGGVHFLEWELLELSAVTIPANAEATIQTVKSFDQKPQAASGHKRKAVVRLIPREPGASGTKVVARKRGAVQLIKGNRNAEVNAGPDQGSGEHPCREGCAHGGGDAEIHRGRESDGRGGDGGV